MRKRRGRTAYTEEFRREALRLVERDVSQLARDPRELGVHPETLRAWWRRARAGLDGPIAPRRGCSRSKRRTAGGMRGRCVRGRRISPSVGAGVSRS